MTLSAWTRMLFSCVSSSIPSCGLRQSEVLLFFLLKIEKLLLNSAYTSYIFISHLKILPGWRSSTSKPLLASLCCLTNSLQERKSRSTCWQFWRRAGLCTFSFHWGASLPSESWCSLSGPYSKLRIWGGFDFPMLSLTGRQSKSVYSRI